MGVFANLIIIFFIHISEKIARVLKTSRALEYEILDNIKFI
jgi:hypothetical protein